MKWRGRRTRDNIVDLRGQGSGARRSGVRLPGLGRRARMGRRAGRAGGLGIGAIAAILLGAWLLGVPIGPLIGMLLGGGGGFGGGVAMAPAPASAPSGPNRIDDATEEFVAVVLADTEEVWTAEFAARDLRYTAPDLVLFTGAVRSGCGGATAAGGPVYCPADQRVYLDTGFFDTLSRELGAGGDFPRCTGARF